jgi:hypothetical protein
MSDDLHTNSPQFSTGLRGGHQSTAVQSYEALLQRVVSEYYKLQSLLETEQKEKEKVLTNLSLVAQTTQAKEQEAELLSHRLEEQANFYRSEMAELEKQNHIFSETFEF